MVGDCDGPLVVDVCVPPLLVVLVLWWEVGVGFGDTLVEVRLPVVELAVCVAVVLLPEFVLDGEGTAVVEAGMGSRHAPA